LVAQEIVQTDPLDRAWRPWVAIGASADCRVALPDTLFVACAEPPRKCAKRPPGRTHGRVEMLRYVFGQEAAAAAAPPPPPNGRKESHQLPHHVRLCLACAQQRNTVLIICLRVCRIRCWFGRVRRNRLTPFVIPRGKSHQVGFLVPIPRGRGTCRFSRRIRRRRRVPRTDWRACHRWTTRRRPCS
jgi:hypothetical protein